MLKNFFLPHHETHQKAYLLAPQALLVYILFFILLQAGFTTLAQVKPGILGISSQVDQQELIKLTNEARSKNNLPFLREDHRLNKAALEKAKNMFEEDYWAHYSPSGKDPWGFISKAGYGFAYAGENLARNFYRSQEVVDAWMDSKTHRENILNSEYQDIGIAVIEGMLKGQKTVLIVQEFGRPTEAIARIPEPNVQGENILPNTESAKTVSILSQNITQPQGFSVTIDQFSVTKTLGILMILMIGTLVIIDFYIIRKRAVVRLSSRHLPHLAFLTAAAGILFNISSGAIL